MTKKEIVKAISEKLGLTQLTTKEIVQQTFDAIIETLVTDGRIELRNFGVFEVKRRAARKARNPRTGGQVEVPAKYVVTFKPGKEMEAKVREMEDRDAAQSSGSSGTPPSATAAQPPTSPPRSVESKSSPGAVPGESGSHGDSSRPESDDNDQPQTIPFQSYAAGRGH